MLKTPSPMVPDLSAVTPDAHHSVRSATASDTMVGRRIKDIRRKNGLTQQQVAARVGVTGAQVHRYEVGTTRVATSRLMAIANVLGVRPADLMRDEASHNAPQVPTALPCSDDLVELVEMFASIVDQRRRGAVVTFARSLALASPLASPQISPASVPAEAA